MNNYYLKFFIDGLLFKTERQTGDNAVHALENTTSDPSFYLPAEVPVKVIVTNTITYISMKFDIFKSADPFND